MMFRGPYGFLSNFYACKIRIAFRGKVYHFTSAEALFQAFKDPNRFEEFVNLDPVAAKKLSHQVNLRPDWSDIKVDLMRKILELKFSQNPELAAKLLETGDTELVEENKWHDIFWGVCNGVGQNWLGRLLMERRDELRKTPVSPACPAYKHEIL